MVAHDINSYKPLLFNRVPNHCCLLVFLKDLLVTLSTCGPPAVLYYPFGLWLGGNVFSFKSGLSCLIVFKP